MNVTLKIKRQKSGENHTAYFQSYNITVDPSDRVLDALITITKTQDSSLAFRKSCAHGICGSDAIRINGKECLACKILFKNILDEQSDNQELVIEPLQHFKVERDLIVNQDDFLEKFNNVKPYFVPKAAPAEQEYIQSPKEREAIEEASMCIGCAACYSACPILETNPNFIGPMALVQAARFIDDSRDKGMEERIDAIDTPDGIWGCENKFECTRVCPRDIKITKIINMTKRNIQSFRK